MQAGTGAYLRLVCGPSSPLSERCSRLSRPFGALTRRRGFAVALASGNRSWGTTISCPALCLALRCCRHSKSAWYSPFAGMPQSLSAGMALALRRCRHGTPRVSQGHSWALPYACTSRWLPCPRTVHAQPFQHVAGPVGHTALALPVGIGRPETLHAHTDGMTPTSQTPCPADALSCNPKRLTSSVSLAGEQPCPWVSPASLPQVAAHTAHLALRGESVQVLATQPQRTRYQLTSASLHLSPRAH